MRSTLKRWLISISQCDLWLAYIASAVLGSMMVFIFVSAILRYAFNAPIVGANEVLGLAAVAMIMLTLPYATTQNTHIRVDLLDNLLGAKAQALTEILYRVIAITVLWFLTKSYVTRALDAYEFDDTTNMLEVTIWPFYALIAFGMGTFALILALQLVAMGVRK